MYDNFVKIVQEKGLTAYRVAKDTGISTATLSNWKNGAYRPKVDKLVILAEYFGIQVEDLIKIESVENRKE